MDEICAQGAAQIRKKKIYDVIYQIEAEKVRRAKASLLEYKRRIEHVRLDVQAQYLELYRRDEEDEDEDVTETTILRGARKAHPRPEEGRPESSCKGMRSN